MAPETATLVRFFVAMNRIYLIRHAESLANAGGIYQGQTYDTRLSDLGERQAHALGEHFRFVHLDRVITSPLTRTSKTAHAIADKKGMTVSVEPRILETNHGLWEGQPKAEIALKWPDLYKNWMFSPGSAVFPGGEHFIHTQKRVLDWWQSSRFLGGVTAVVTHDNIIRIIVADIMGLDLNNIWDIELHPAAITEVITDAGKAVLTQMNYHQHLNGIKSDLQAHAL